MLCHCTKHTHQWYKINANEIHEIHKLALGDYHSTHIVPISPTEPPEVNALTTLTFYKLNMNMLVTPAHNPCTVM